MTDLTNVPVRNINDLELAENIPLDASVLDAVKIPVGGLTQFTQGEALSLKQLREVLVAAMPGWVPSTIDDLIDRSDAEVQKMLDKYLNAIKDVSVVLDAIQGQINESHLALELNKKIEIGTLANDIANRAQETANAAYAAAEDAEKAAIAYAEDRVKEAEQTVAQLVLSTEEQINAAKTQAQQLTEQARQDAQALITALDQKFAALNGNINTEISNLNAGLTQETTARQEGLAQITTTLNAYKVVVDDNLAVLFSKNETIVSDAAALATQVNALKSQVALVEGALSLKLDASIIQNYYTKTEAAENATTVAAGEISKYDANLVIGGANLFSLKELLSFAGGDLSNATSYITVTGSTLSMVDQGYGYRLPGNLIPIDHTKDIIVSWYPIDSYSEHSIYYATQDASGALVEWQRNKTGGKGADGRVIITIPKSELSPTVTHLRLGIGSVHNTTYSIRDIQVEQGTKVTAWSPSPRDTQASLDANATAIQNTDTEVSRVNNEVVSQGQSLTTLQNNLNNTNGEVAKKADATVVDGVTSRVAATETGLTSVGNRTTALENSVNHATNGLATKASTSALNTTDSNVSALDGTVKGHTNQLTNLAASIQVINGTLSNKLDASVINNYYTKAQSDASADTIAAGKIDQFNANLIIGGVNLIPNSFDVPQVSNNGVVWPLLVDVVDGVRRICRIGGDGPSIMSNYTNEFINLPVGTVYTLSVKVRPIGSDYLLRFYQTDSSTKLCKDGQWTTLHATYTATEQPGRVHALESTAVQQGVWVEVKEWQAEIGNKATAWAPSPKDFQTAIDANATALQTTNAEVARVDDKTTVNTNSITSLAGEMTQVKNGLTTKADASALQNYYTKTEAAENATTVAAGEISKYDANLVIGGTNIFSLKELLSYSGGGLNNATSYITVTGSTLSMVDQGYGYRLPGNLIPIDHTKDIIVSWYPVGSYSGHQIYYATQDASGETVVWQRHKSGGLSADGRVVITIPKSELSPTVTHLRLGLGSVDNTTYSIRDIQVEQGTKVTAWTPSPRDTQASLDANAAAIQNTNVEVNRVDGKTTTNANAITGLTSQIGIVEGQVASKLDASVIQNYYTKGQADEKSAEIAAGKIESYDANLVIGGTNLYTGPNPIPMVGQTSEGMHNATSAYFGVIQLYRYLENSWFDLQDVAIGDDVITSLEIMVPSDSVVGEHSIYIGAYRFGNNWYLQSEHKPLKEFPRDKWVKVAVPAGKFVDTGLTTPGDINISIYLSGCDVGTSFKWRNLMMEKGTKASAFSVSDKTLQFNINANANAIQTTNVEVARVNGEVVSTANSVNNLSSNVGLLQGSINEVRQTVTNNQESTNTLVTSLRSGMADADDVSMMMRNATVIFEDLNFSIWTNGVTTYNNYENGALVSNFTDKLPDNPVASTRQIQFMHLGGATTPGLGGFYQPVLSRANGVFLVKFVAKLPIGFSFELRANAYGDGANAYFIGSSEGTGKFKTYYAVYRCGATGSFSTVGFVAVNGPQPTSENPLIWYLASSTVYDCLDSKVAPDSVVNGIAEAKSTASTAINKADATAIVAQNIQAALDNTNAKLSTDYYTKSSTDQAIASATNQLSSSFDTSIKGVGVIRDTRYANNPPSWYWTNYPHRTEKEFKFSSIIGIPVATVDTLGVLETTVPWIDSSGGPIQQRFSWADSAYALTRYSISENEWSAWASAINEVKTAVDRKLDANIISNYYTKAEADNVVAGKVEQFSSSIAVGGANLWSVVNATRISEQGTHSVRVTREAEEELWITVNSHSDYGTSLIRFDSCLVDQNTPFIAGEDLVLSFEVSGSGYSKLGMMYTYVGALSGLIQIPNIITNPSIWQRVVFKFKAAGAETAGASQLLGFRMDVADGWSVGTTLSIRHIQLQRGNTATTFNKAPALARAAIQETTQTINGIEAIKTVTIDNNGVMSGYGLISELKNGQVRSSFGVNADTFFIGSPSSDKKPFIQKNDWSVINGVWVPPGTYIDTAYIANATIDTAKIADLAVTGAKIADAAIGTAKIENAAISTAKIGDLQVNTFKIKNNAVSIMRQYTLQRTDAVNGTLYSNDVSLILNTTESSPISADVIIQATITPYGSVPSNASISCSLRFAGTAVDEVTASSTLAGGVQVLQGLVSMPNNSINYAQYLQLHVRLTNFGLNSEGKRGFKVNYNVWTMYK